MGMLTLDVEEDINFMVMSESESELEEIQISNLITSSLTHALVQCEESVSQEKWKKNASHIDDNKLFHDYLELTKNHESLQKLLASYMKDKTKLSNDLDSAREKIKNKHCDINDIHVSYDNLMVSHQKLEHTIVECRCENNKLADILEEKEYDHES